MNLSNLTFANPWFLLLLLLIPIFILWRWLKRNEQFPEMRFSTLEAFSKTTSWKARLRPVLFLLKIIAFGALVTALARPQNLFTEEKITTDGIDIVLVMDISGSMLARDFTPDRLEASKEVAARFIKSRPHDRIGLVVFAGESFSQTPITTDQNVLNSMLAEIKSGIIEDGTAIGMGLATAVTRLQESQAKSKVVILLTDGVNNSGFIDPLTAAETAKQFEAKVYTIGVGTKGKAPYPVRGIFGTTQLQYIDVQIDEELLQKIADMTGGKYFRATNNTSLERIYDEIDQLEKTEIEISTINRYSEQFYFFAFLAAMALALEILLRNTLFRGIT